jgi:hypothetical protein
MSLHQHASSSTMEKSIDGIISPVQELGLILEELPELYDPNVLAKIWGVALPAMALPHPPTAFPEAAPQKYPSSAQYNYREAKFWTCGFFPGSLYSLLERKMRFQDRIPSIPVETSLLLRTCRWWSNELHIQARRTNTHDMGFIVLPALRKDWELTKDQQSLESIITAASNLATRFDQRVGAIRSWDRAVNKRYRHEDTEKDFLVIIDSMCSKF